MLLANFNMKTDSFNIKTNHLALQVTPDLHIYMRIYTDNSCDVHTDVDELNIDPSSLIPGKLDAKL